MIDWNAMHIQHPSPANVATKGKATTITVLSRSSYQKDGVLDEIAMAVGTGRKLAKPSFVIPVRLDDLPFGDFPEQLIRLNAIDFAANWTDGLSRVQEALLKAGVPKENSAETSAFDQWRGFRMRQGGATVETAEQLSSNWLRIIDLPQHINFCRFGSDTKPATRDMTTTRVTSQRQSTP